jgi:hypothetical protein
LARTKSVQPKPVDWTKFIVNTPEHLIAPKRRKSLRYYGPEQLNLRKSVVFANGPEEFVQNNPHLFATGTTSRHEGYFYWGLFKRIGREGEPGKQGRTWFYQSKVGGGSNRPGGSIVDFIIEGVGPNPDLGVRIVTPYFHGQIGPYKRATDFEQSISLLDQDILAIDIDSRDYVGDPDGSAVLYAVDRVLNYQQSSFSPLYAGFRGF